jgi:hypothetical protein
LSPPASLDLLKTRPPMPPPAEDSVLRSSRREALVVLVIWTVACIYSVGYSFWFGYQRDPETLTFVLGIPDWVFWGVAVPWACCTVASFWVSHSLIADEDLGEVRPEAKLGKEADRD